MHAGGQILWKKSRTKLFSHRRRLISNRGTVISLAALLVDLIHVNNEKERLRILAGVQRQHGTALIACHLHKHKPPVDSIESLIDA